MEYVLLSDVGSFSDERISMEHVTVDNYISTENMVPNKGGVIQASSLPDAKKVSKYNPGDILLSNIRPYFKKIWFADCSGGCSNDVLVFHPNKDIDAKFLYYVLSDNNFFNYATLTSKGTKMPRGTKHAILKYWIPSLPLKTQQRIASILSAYDSQIENNQIRIKLLEQMAENLYKEWFVRFRFPGYETAEFEGEEPKGWRQVTLGEYANVIMGQSPESCFYNNEKQGLPFHQGVGSYGDFYLQDDIYSTEGKRLAEANSIIFSVRAPVGRINITLNKIILGRGVAGINAKNGNNAFLLWLLKHKFSKEDIIGNGSIFTSVTKDELLGQKVLIPTRTIEESFNTTASNIEKEIRSLTIQKDNLTLQRDHLLPRLMSGKLSI